MNHRSHLVFATTLAISALASRSALAQCELDKLTATGAVQDTQLGTRVDLSGDRFVVGAEDQTAYMFARFGNMFVQEDTLTPNGGTSGSEFGRIVALSSEWAVVGDPSDSTLGTNAGAAYVYKRQGSNWSQLAVLTAPDGGANQFFGSSVDVLGDTLVVGAPLAPGAGTNDGAVYAYARAGNSWNFEEKILPNQTDSHRFGTAVSLSGLALAVGSPLDNNGSDPAGACYIFLDAGSTWTEFSRIALTGGGGIGIDEFGTNVALAGDLVVIARNLPGTTYIFERNGTSWLLEQTVNLPAGDAISISGNKVLIGNNSDDFMASNAGVAVIWEQTGNSWNEALRFYASDPNQNDRFGSAVSIAGAAAVVTAPFDDGAANNAGGAYSFVVIPVPQTDCNSDGRPDQCELTFFGAQDCNGNGALDECDVSSGSSADVNQNGVPDECEVIGTNYCMANDNSTGNPAILFGFGSEAVFHNDLDLLTVDAAPNQFGYYLMSMNQGFVPLFGGSQGNLCLAFPIVRYSSDILFSGPSGRMLFSPDFQNLPSMTEFVPGQSWNFQCWYRDINPAFTSNTSDGLQINFSAAIGPEVQFEEPSQALDEVTTMLEIPITLSEPAGLDIEIPWSVSGSAIHDVDWRVEEANPFVIPAGTAVTSMSVLIVGDGVCELDETGIISMGTPTNAELGLNDEHTINIIGSHGEVEPNDTIGQANLVGTVMPGSTCTILGNVDVIGSSDDVDIFRIEATAATLLDFTLTPAHPGADVVLSLTDEFGLALQGHNSNGPGGPETGQRNVASGDIILFQVLTTGSPTDYELIISGS
ncbi:MAG: hypothetical protein GY711_23785 [bacterium]|nr:hypothetical protein [bacterium]